MINNPMPNSTIQAIGQTLDIFAWDKDCKVIRAKSKNSLELIRELAEQEIAFHSLTVEIGEIHGLSDGTVILYIK